MTPPGFAAATWLVARKDLAIEFRTRSAFVSTLVFALLAVVIFYFAWDASAVRAADLAPGVHWVTFVFGGLLALHRSFAAEQADGALDALLGAPIPREAVFAGKALANLAFVLAVQAVTIPALVIVYNLPAGRAMAAIGLLAALASVGMVAIGTLFSAIVANTRLAELLLPVLALPFFVPIVMPAAQATARLLAGRPVGEVVGWLQLLGAFDIVFAVACTLAYPFTLDD